jgi:hypothetical protein
MLSKLYTREAEAGRRTKTEGLLSVRLTRMDQVMLRQILSELAQQIW